MTSLLSTFFIGSFSNVYAFGTMLNTACLIMCAGIGACFSNKCGHMNLGGEGQIYLSGYVVALILTTNSNEHSIFTFMFAMLSSIICGAMLTSVSAFLYHKKKAFVLLTSFLLSSAIIPIIDSAIISSINKSGNNLLATPFIQNFYRIPQILKPSPLNLSLFLILFLCLVFYFILYRTYIGRQIQIRGISKEFCEYSGYSDIKCTYISLCISGALHGLTGFFAVTGTYYTCHKSFALGMGWNALSAALIAKSNPLLVIPSSLVLAWLYTSADRVSLTQGFNFDAGGILQGVILLFTAIPFLTKTISIRRNKL